MKYFIRFFVTIILWIGILFGERTIHILPFDWSGQNGLISVNGQLFWNQDWMSGPLYFDGTFSNYPFRYGSSYFESFQPVNFNEIPSHESLPDSNMATNSFDYRKGDYLFDQLDIKADFGDESHLLRINGFKRTYAGTFGEYIQPEGILTPNQQSYRLDYLSTSELEKVYASTAHFVTNSGIPDSSMNGHHKNITTTAGIIYTKIIGDNTLDLHSSQFNQERSMAHSSLDSTLSSFINRTHIHMKWTTKTNKSIGVITDNQIILHNKLRDLQWATIYGGLNGERLTTSLGGSFLSKGNSYALYLKSSFLLQGKSWKMNSGLSYSTKPIHIALMDTTQFFEAWSRVYLNIEKTISSFRFQSANNLGSMTYPGLGSNSNYYSSELSMLWEIFSRCTVAGMVGMYETLWSNSSLVGSIPLTDGFRRKIQFSIKGFQPFFNGNMMAYTKLRVIGNLNREQNHGYDFVNAIPLLDQTPTTILPDYWVIHFEFSAVVSNITFTWQIQNVLNAYESPAKKIFPNLNNDYLLIQNNRDFSPMGQLISFNVLWNFEN